MWLHRIENDDLASTIHRHKIHRLYPIIMVTLRICDHAKDHPPHQPHHLISQVQPFEPFYLAKLHCSLNFAGIKRTTFYSRYSITQHSSLHLHLFCHNDGAMPVQCIQSILFEKIWFSQNKHPNRKRIKLKLAIKFQLLLFKVLNIIVFWVFFFLIQVIVDHYRQRPRPKYSSIQTTTTTIHDEDHRALTDHYKCHRHLYIRGRRTQQRWA